MKALTGRRSLLRCLLIAPSSAVAGLLFAMGSARADPVHDAAKAGDLAKVKQLLASDPAALDRRDADGKTALLLAMESKSAEIASFLVSSKADVRLADNVGMSPLLFALKAETKAVAYDDPAIAALWAAMPPVALQLSNVALSDAFSQLFAQIKIPATNDVSLTAPISLTINGSFDLALRSLLRLARRTTGQTPTLVVSDGGVHVGLGKQQMSPTTEEIWPIATIDARFRFQAAISRSVLENYLSRAVTHMGLLAGSPEGAAPYFDDDVRMLTSIRAKFIGRAACAWAPPDDDDAHFRMATERARIVHKADPEIILQAAVFETAYRSVERIAIPHWVFTEFRAPVETRNFRYGSMLYDGGKFHDHWMHDASVPDMSKCETQMWFYYRARRYIDAGCEGIHFGQIGLMNQNDPGNLIWASLLSRIRKYAANYGRRSFVLCDAHTHGVVVGGRLLFDLHAWPLRTMEARGGTADLKGELRLDHGDSLIGNSLGGTTPSGWSCGNLPYIVEFDNWGSCGKAGQPGVGFPWIWGYDEICWFAHLSEANRNDYLQYAREWVRRVDSAGHVQLPTRRNLADSAAGQIWFQANRKSDACPTGFNQEDTIREIFAAS